MSIPNFTQYFSSYEGISEILKNYSFTEIISQVSSMVNVDIKVLANYPVGGYMKGKEKSVYK